MNIRSWFTKKRLIWGSIIIVLALVIGGCVVKGRDKSGDVLTEAVRRQGLKRSVLATGQVVSKTDLSLSFKVSGVVEKVAVAEGQAVKSGDVLATLGQRDQLAALTSARGALAQAQANYQRVVDGASSEEVVVAQRAVDAAKVTLDNAKTSLKNTVAQQDVLVQNAYKALLNTGLQAVSAVGNSNATTPTVSGTYTGTEQGTYLIQQEGSYFYLSGLEVRGNEKIETALPSPLGTKGLYLQFPSGYVVGTDRWTVDIPNTKASGYVAAYNAHQSALQTRTASVDAATAQVSSAQVALSQAEASLALKKAAARPAELEAAQAQVLSAQGQVQSALASLENTVVRAPADGVITSVDIKVGELASALKTVLVLQDVANLHVEANVSEANIAAVKTGQVVDLTFDALGPDRHFKGTVQFVNPASVVVSGVVNYKVTFAVENVSDIKPGMTANVTVLIEEKQDVLAVPVRAVISSNGKKTVRVVTDQKKKAYRDQEVTLGLEADGGLVEVTGGLSEGETVITFIKK